MTGANRLRRQALVCAIVVISAIVLTTDGSAAASYKHHRRHTISHHHHHHYRHHRRAHKPVALYHALLLEDADTGRILYDYNGGIQWPPASLAKMMTLLVAEDQLKAGRVHLDDPVTISRKAADTGGSGVTLRAGQVIPLRELMKAALIRSANDAAVAVAQKVCGSIERCVVLMNERAKSLGMTHTHYRTVDGLPPRPLHDVDTTDAYDLAKLARTLIYHTDLLHWSRLKTASFDGGEAILHNTNHLIGHYRGCDGLKTGFTFKAGFNVIATARRGNMRLVAVVLGAPSNRQRFAQAAKLLNWGFDNFTRVTLLKEGELLPVHVRVGTNGLMMQPVTQSKVAVVVRKKDVHNLTVDYNVPESLYGPVASDQRVGQVIVRNGSHVLDKVDAICPFPIGQSPSINAMGNGEAPVK